MEIRSERAHPLARRPPKARTLAGAGEDRETQELPRENGTASLGNNWTGVEVLPYDCQSLP